MKVGQGIIKNQTRWRTTTVLLLAALAAGWPRAIGAQPPAAAASRMLGYQRCAECHKSEVDAWMHSAHSNTASKLKHPKAPQFVDAAKKAGLSEQLCASCHDATRGSDAVAFAHHGGVSCESCHGPAGPDKSTQGWFSVHSLTDDKLALAKRKALCQSAGMNRAADALALASNCLACHTVPHEAIVNAGHPTSKRFELVEWAQGEVRHNFQRDPKQNAAAPSLWLSRGQGRTVASRKGMMFILGQLADLETSLRNRAGVKDPRGDFGSAMNRRITAAQRELEPIDLPETKYALKATADINRQTLREFTPQDAVLYTTAADQVRRAAEALVKRHPNGEGLAEAVPKLPTAEKGEPYLGK